MKVRPYRVQDLHRVADLFFRVGRAAYRDIVSPAFLEAMTREQAIRRFEGLMTLNRAFGYVAENAEGLVGFSTGWFPEEPIDGYNAELKTIYVLPSFHRRGIGKTLFYTVVDHFQQHDACSMSLEVFRDNHAARRMYEALGGRPVHDFVKRIFDEDYWITRYGWPDLSALRT